MSIVELRQIQAALAERYKTVSDAIEQIFAIRAPFTETLAKASIDAWNESFRFVLGYQDDEPPEEMYQSLVGDTVCVADANFLFPLLRNDVMCRNMETELAEIRKLVGTEKFWLDRQLPNPIEPCSIGWLDEEIDAVVKMYRYRINRATMRLRDINTNWKYLSQTRCKLPGFIKPALTGMFGGPDLLSGYTYTDDDFRIQYNNSGPIIGNEIVLSARWLAPFIGVENAKIVEDAMEIIGKVSSPLPGEPPTIDYFGSHVNNAIDVFKVA